MAGSTFEVLISFNEIGIQGVYSEYEKLLYVGNSKRVLLRKNIAVRLEAAGVIDESTVV